VINHFASPHPVLYFFSKMVNPVTQLLGWTTRLRVSDIIEGHPIHVERIEKVSRLSVHSVIIAQKEPINGHS
jgi:phosphatidylethanolamine/phosphatidyl-N-methylethanolamine N-methyltransferase